MNKITVERDGKLSKIIYGFSPDKNTDVGCIEVTVVSEANKKYSIEVHEDCSDMLSFTDSTFEKYFEPGHLSFDKTFNQLAIIDNIESIEAMDTFGEYIVDVVKNRWESINEQIKHERAQDRLARLESARYNDYGDN